MSAATRSITLTIAGSDSSGGAGIQADLKTFSALGVYGASVITALTAQNTMGVRAVHTPPPEFVRAQIQAVLDDLAVGAVKTGMLANAAVLAVVADELARRPALTLVVDPVMVATSGDRLLEPDAIATMTSRLLPLALLVTPNLAEAAALLGSAQATSLADMEAQARALLAFGSRAVLLKGGHAAGEARGRDVLVTAAGACHVVEGRWIETRNTHGTGCTLSAAITALLALGDTLPDAVAHAKSYLTSALEHGRDAAIGAGHGPVDHLFAIRPARS